MEDIKLLKIEYKYLLMMPAEEKTLSGIKIEFDYKQLRNCELSFEVDNEISIKEIKERILKELRR